MSKGLASSCLTSTRIVLIDQDCINSGRVENIRLYGIDCPERRQPFDNRAKQFASALVIGKTVQVEPVTTDWYGRTVACVIVDGKSISHELVRAAMAWRFQLYAPGH